MFQEKRRVVCAANRCPNSHHMILGARHWDKAMQRHYGLFSFAGYTDSDVDFSEQGFIDQYGEFLNRQEAWKVAEAAGQIIRRGEWNESQGGTLYSENLY